jgi:protein-S-isoprenylcysteine O-methyltransferase Ste14
MRIAPSGGPRIERSVRDVCTRCTWSVRGLYVVIRWLLDGPLRGFPDLPPIWLGGFLAAAWALDRGLPLVQAFGPLLRAAGVVLMLGAAGLILWSALWFWRKRTTIEPHHPPTALIVEGPYRLSRNPIYLALLGILTGYVMVLGTLGPALLPVAFAHVLTRRFIAPEEKTLRRIFGAEAEAYLARTRRWF